MTGVRRARREDRTGASSGIGAATARALASAAVSDAPETIEVNGGQLMR